MVGEAAAAEVEAAAAAAGGDVSAPRWKAALRDAFASFMNRPQDMVTAQVGALVARLSSAGDAATLPTPDAVALRLNAQFPNDVGVFAPYLLNVLTLSPGQAIFLAANEPHAYLSGDCVEVMACSDNVVRAGLTPKWKDVDTLCSMLTFNSGLPPVQDGRRVDAWCTEYDAPVPEFTLQRIHVNPSASASASGAATYTLPPVPSAAILVVIEGGATAQVHVKGGPALAAADGTAVPIAASSSGSGVPSESATGGAGSTSTSSGSGAMVEQRLSEGGVWLQPANAEVTLTLAQGKDSILLFRTHAKAE